MKEIPITEIKHWFTQGQIEGADVVSTNCPWCNERGLFKLKSHQYDQPRNVFSSTASCSGCSKMVHFWTVEPKGGLSNSTEHGKVFMYPIPKNRIDELTFDDEVPEQLVRSYRSTIDAYNSKNYSSTAVCCRRTLEGMFKYLLPEGNRKIGLAKAIEEAINSVNFSKPLSSLSHAIRQGGNLGAHFDLDKEPNEDMARSMVELLQYLLSYLYVLPREIEKLENVLSGDE